MCNRCGCNNNFDDRNFGRSNRNNDGCWDNGLFEVERINHQVRNNRCCENRCAAQYCHCMRHCRRCNNWD